MDEPYLYCRNRNTCVRALMDNHTFRIPIIWSKTTSKQLIRIWIRRSQEKQKPTLLELQKSPYCWTIFFLSVLMYWSLSYQSLVNLFPSTSIFKKRFRDRVLFCNKIYCLFRIRIYKKKLGLFRFTLNNENAVQTFKIAIRIRNLKKNFFINFDFDW